MNSLIRSERDNRGMARQIELHLRQAIISLELRPGTQVSEQEIAYQFAVSRQPVREALIWLSRAGLVEIQPQRGTKVVKISATRMMQARIIREEIEVGVVRRACEIGLHADQIIELRQCIQRQQKALEHRDHSTFKAADEDFHKALAIAASLPMAWETVFDIMAHLQRVCHLTLADMSAIKPLIKQHSAIVDAIALNDAISAERVMRSHLQEILLAMPDAMERHPDYFE